MPSHFTSWEEQFDLYKNLNDFENEQEIYEQTLKALDAESVTTPTPNSTRHVKYTTAALNTQIGFRKSAVNHQEPTLLTTTAFHWEQILQRLVAFHYASREKNDENTLNGIASTKQALINAPLSMKWADAGIWMNVQKKYAGQGTYGLLELLLKENFNEETSAGFEREKRTLANLLIYRLARWKYQRDYFSRSLKMESNKYHRLFSKLLKMAISIGIETLIQWDLSKIEALASTYNSASILFVELRDHISARTDFGFPGAYNYMLNYHWYEWFGWKAYHISRMDIGLPLNKWNTNPLTFKLFARIKPYLKITDNPSNVKTNQIQVPVWEEIGNVNKVGRLQSVKVTHAWELADGLGVYLTLKQVVFKKGSNPAPGTFDVLTNTAKYFPVGKDDRKFAYRKDNLIDTYAANELEAFHRRYEDYIGKPQAQKMHDLELLKKEFDDLLAFVNVYLDSVHWLNESAKRKLEIAVKAEDERALDRLLRQYIFSRSEKPEPWWKIGRDLINRKKVYDKIRAKFEAKYNKKESKLPTQEKRLAFISAAYQLLQAININAEGKYNFNNSIYIGGSQPKGNRSYSKGLSYDHNRLDISYKYGLGNNRGVVVIKAQYKHLYRISTHLHGKEIPLKSLEEIQLGIIGSHGFSTGPHLHVATTVKKDGGKIDYPIPPSFLFPNK